MNKQETSAAADDDVDNDDRAMNGRRFIRQRSNKKKMRPDEAK